jgi:hypothetical protein
LINFVERERARLEGKLAKEKAQSNQLGFENSQINQ